MSTCSENDTASCTSSDSISNELDDLLQCCKQLHEHIQNSTETLHAIHQMVSLGENIKITVDSTTRDFNELLEELHMVALERVREGKQSNFGATLLAMLEQGHLE